MVSPFTPPLTGAEIEAAIPGVRVQQVLGAGGQGIAYKVDADQFGTSALKVYGPRTVASRVDREIDKLQRLASDFVVRLYGNGDAVLRGEHCRFALMEFVDGDEANALIGQLDDQHVDDELRRVLMHIGQGIADMWSLRVVHRDIKPGNVMRRSDGRYVVLDLGLAKHLDESTLTQMGFTCGTPGYMSPEQAAARRGLTLRSDMFALGLLVYEMGAGVHPYMRRQDLIGRISVQRLRDARPAVSEAVSSLVNDLLQTSPLARPRRSGDIVAALA